MDMTPDELKEVMKDAMNEVLEPLYVDREKHFMHHEFLDRVIHMTDIVQGTVCKGLITVAMSVIFGLILLGIIFWGKSNIK